MSRVCEGGEKKRVHAVDFNLRKYLKYVNILNDVKLKKSRRRDYTEREGIKY